MVYNWLKNILLGFLPRQCLLCLSPTKTKHAICLNCEDDLSVNTHYCVICSIPFAPPHPNKNKLVCGICQKNPPNYTTSSIPHLYTSPVKQLVTKLKFDRNLTYAPLLAQNFVNAIQHRKNTLPECIIPVPLHKQRLRERGFNQALELAQIISKKLNIPCDHSFCQRDKATPFQSGLSAKQRKQNLKNAFSITKNHAYKHVAIFDDVVTTGTTVNELARQLKKSGVEIIEIWTIARTANKN